MILCLILLLTLSYVGDQPALRMPIDTHGAAALEALNLTNIGAFGLMRKGRPGIPSHLHTGIDIVLPSAKYLEREYV